MEKWIYIFWIVSHRAKITHNFRNAPFCNLFFSCREAASNFLTALGMQRKSRSRQLSHQVMSGNIWAALRIALSMLDQPELFQAANIGDLDLLMRAFNLDMWARIPFNHGKYPKYLMGRTLSESNIFFSQSTFTFLRTECRMIPF